jgi:hypothetical protein
MDKEMRDINEVTNNLIYSKLSGPQWAKWIKAKIIKYFGIRPMYDFSYGNLIDLEEGRGEDGRPYRNMKLKDEDTINAMAQNGQITQEEYDFYQMFRSYTERYGRIVKKERGKLQMRQGYIPHLNAHVLEAYSGRGMMNAYLVSRGGKTDPNVRQVVITAADPLSRTGAMKTAPLSYFEDAYKAKDHVLNVVGTAKFFALKQRAIRLYNQGKNQDGSPLELDYITRDTLLDGSWMDRFTSARSVRAQDLPTLDLNHALTAYVKASMWKYGNKEEKKR